MIMQQSAEKKLGGYILHRLHRSSFPQLADLVFFFADEIRPCPRAFARKTTSEMTSHYGFIYSSGMPIMQSIQSQLYRQKIKRQLYKEQIVDHSISSPVQLIVISISSIIYDAYILLLCDLISFVFLLYSILFFLYTLLRLSSRLPLCFVFCFCFFTPFVLCLSILLSFFCGL